MKLNLLRSALVLAVGLGCSISSAQPDRWQQAVTYEMDIDFDVKNHQFSGTQKLVYHNNSPDTLHRVFYHLYFNAFQPGSMMDVRSRNIIDPDQRVSDRISKLQSDEIGYQKIKSLNQDGEAVQYQVVGTILEVDLAKPILPGTRSTLVMDFHAQVPIQIRRSGRNNSEGIDYSMSQWYPKLCEYDYQGWHANPYIAREFYGNWGDFDVRITIDSDYIIGATGYLQNPEQIGYGYTQDGQEVKRKGRKLTWHFMAPQVHDFVWAADPDYTHTTFTRDDGMVMHFFFQENGKTKDAWSKLPAIMDQAFDYINATYGQYPYAQYAFIQGGDGGMEYPMATLITGERSLPSLVGVSVHELMHSWYQGVLGSNESLYAWMDEGFTSFASSDVMNHLRKVGALKGSVVSNPWAGNVAGFAQFSMSGREEPMSTHADHFITNTAYSVSAYVKGAVFLAQLRYIIGEEAFERGMLRYFDTWKFKHPNPNDFIRVMEKISGMELDWYKEYMLYLTRTVDYGIVDVSATQDGSTGITLSNLGSMPLPVDLEVRLKDGTSKYYQIPLRIMRGHKEVEGYNYLKAWPWTHPTYTLELDIARQDIREVVIDPKGYTADVDRNNNQWSDQP